MTANASSYLEKIRAKWNSFWNEKPKHQEGTWTEEIIAILAILLVRTFIAEPSMVPSESMSPTLLTGDFIIINKFAYRSSLVNIPLIGGLFVSNNLAVSKSIKRGSLLVFTKPGDYDHFFAFIYLPRHYTKRAIALPEDTIRFSSHSVHVNDEQVFLRDISKAKKYTLRHDDAKYEKMELYQACLKNDGVPHFYPILFSKNQSFPETEEMTYTVPNGYLFAMGSNFHNSTDSRFAPFGDVPMGRIVGAPFCVIFSTNALFSRNVSSLQWIVELPWRICVSLYMARWNRIGIILK